MQRRHHISLITLVFLCLPDNAYAWGIGVHLQVGSWLLATPGVLAPALAALLSRYRNDFFYGCISADITLGKKYTHYLEHCHGWRIAEKILQTADSDSRTAFAWGYVAHLAADTVAHGYFVPYKLVRTYNTSLLKHAYWEMRMEALVEPQIWEIAHQVARRNYADNDRLLQSVLSDTLFSFSTNKRLFNSMVLLNRLKHWQRALQTLERRSQWEISVRERNEYLQLAREAAQSVLNDMTSSPYRHADPTGERAIRTANALRRNLKTLWREGKLTEVSAQRYLHGLKSQFRDSITQPDILLGLSLTEERSYPVEPTNRTTRSSR